MLSPRKAAQWMSLCVEGARIFAVCSRRQYFAVVLDANGYVLSTGYNGVPAGELHCVDGGCPRAASNVPHGSPYTTCPAIHAEDNAIRRANKLSCIGGTIVINGPPCVGCAQLIAKSGLSTLVYSPDPAYDAWPVIRDLLELSGIEIVEVG